MDRERASEMIRASEEVADEVLAPAAEDVDRTGRIPDDHLRALAERGVFGIAGPVDAGGADLDAVTARRVVATIGGSCGATFFVWVQHHGVVRTLRATENAALGGLLPDLCTGELIAGTAFAHVRRQGPPAVTARRVEGGWRLDGRAPWATSWGIADVFSIAAVTDDDRIVWGLIDGREPAGVAASPLELPVLSATGTVVLDLDGCVVPDERIALVESRHAWAVADRRKAAIGQPATIGVAERATRLLGEVAADGRTGDDEAALDAHRRLVAELRTTWQRDAELVARLAAPPGEDPDRDGDDSVSTASAHRAACLHLARRATTALLAAVGGRGMDLRHPAQRLAREADFYVIQAQTADGRAATLASI